MVLFVSFPFDFNSSDNDIKNDSANFLITLLFKKTKKTKKTKKKQKKKGSKKKIFLFYFGKSINQRRFFLLVNVIFLLGPQHSAGGKYV